jgi:hypothetical protein
MEIVRSGDIGHGRPPRQSEIQRLARVPSATKTSKLWFVLVAALSYDADRWRGLELGANAGVVIRAIKYRVDRVTPLDAIEELLP